MDLGSIFTMAAYGGAALAGLTIIGSGLFTTPQKHDTLITRFGKHVRTVTTPGLNWKIPIIDQIHDKVSKKFREFSVQDEDGQEGLQIKTSDGLFVRLPVKIQGWVEDTAKYTFDNTNPLTVISTLIRNEVKGFANGKSFDQLYQQDTDDVGGKVTESLREKILAQTGFHIDNIVIDEPTPPQSLQQSYNAVREEENFKKAKITKAEGDKDAQIEAGKGVAGFRREVFDGYADQIKELKELGISESAAAEMVMETMRMDTLRDIGDKGNMVIVTDGRGKEGAEFADYLTKQAAMRHVGVPAGEQNNTITPAVASGPA